MSPGLPPSSHDRNGCVSKVGREELHPLVGASRKVPGFDTVTTNVTVLEYSVVSVTPWDHGPDQRELYDSVHRNGGARLVSYDSESRRTLDDPVRRPAPPSSPLPSHTHSRSGAPGSPGFPSPPRKCVQDGKSVGAVDGRRWKGDESPPRRRSESGSVGSPGWGVEDERRRRTCGERG